MIVTNTACTNLQITSDLITDYLAEAPTFTSELEIEVTVNGGTTAKIPLTSDELTIGTLSYDFTPEQGVYSFLLRKTTGSTVTEEELCFFLPCDLKCDLIKCLAADPDTAAWKYYQALEWVGECELCTCTKAAEIYSKLIEFIEAEECRCLLT